MEEVVPLQIFPADGFTVNNLPTDGSTLKIYVYSYENDGSTIPSGGIKTYFATAHR